MSLPTGVGVGTITGRFVIGVIDSPYDQDSDPEMVPAQGRISFTPSIQYVPNSTNGIPMTIMKSTITGVLDDEGYLCTPDSMSPNGYSRGVNLFATDTGQVENWTYTVKYNFQTMNNVSPNIPDHSISVPDGSTQDLTTLVKVPSSPGIGIPQMESFVLRAESVAQSVRDDADAGLFDGEKGDVGPMGPPVALEIGTVTASAGNPADDDIMSTLILSGTKTQAAIKAQIPIEQIGEQGPKGDPGGWVVSHLGPGADLNALTAPGVYSVGSSSYAKIENGFPIEAVCYVEVLSSGTTHVQRVTVAGGGSSMKVQYERRHNGAVWDSWCTFTSTRVDNTAGKAIYQWDPTVNQEQMIYGDTGWRKMELAESDAILSGSFHWKRVNERVYLRFVNVILKPGNGYVGILTGVPAGFRQLYNERTMQSIGLTNNAITQQVITAFTGTIGWVYQITSGSANVARPSTGLSGTIFWNTDDPWPTELPGTPV